MDLNLNFGSTDCFLGVERVREIGKPRGSNEGKRNPCRRKKEGTGEEEKEKGKRREELRTGVPRVMAGNSDGRPGFLSEISSPEDSTPALRSFALALDARCGGSREYWPPRKFYERRQRVARRERDEVVFAG